MSKKHSGLTKEQVLTSRTNNGTNKLSERKSETIWQKLIGNFEDPIIKILCVALVINIVFTFLGQVEWYETVFIAVAVLIATVVSTLAEYSNENSFKKLQEDASRIMCKVFRDGKVEEVLIDDIVVGDLVVLQAGDMIPTDGKLIEGTLSVDQATLNGESKEAKKKVMPENYNENGKVDFLDEYKLFRGTVVVEGEAVMEVATVGDKTFYGQLALEMQVDDRKSPLTVKLEKLAGQISLFGYIGGGAIGLAYLFQTVLIHNNFDMALIMEYVTNWSVFGNDLVTALILAIVIIVVAVPEGLPMMIAMVLALNMKKMLKDNVLVRKLIGIETAGSLNILLSDKTGTITKGELEVVEFIDGAVNSVSSYSDLPVKIKELTNLAITQNTNAIVNITDGKLQILGGNATERAVIGFVDHKEKVGYSVNTVKSIPFNSENKYSATQVEGDYNLTLLKGAPERIVAKCTHFYDKNGNKVEFTTQDVIMKKMDELASKAIRVLALATTEQVLEDGIVFEELTLVGILGIRDDIRPEAVLAIKEVQEAGVQVVMITGDRKETAVAIAKEAGLLQNNSDIVLTSEELNTIDDNKLKEMIPNIRVIARALPTDKSRLVRLAQDLNLVVGMTGDGVNDAPALKRADVGFAMGSGTEVAKEAGDIVILDDNFQSIAKAVLYGRTIYHNIRKFIVFQLTINVSAVLINFIGPLIGVLEPLSITQMLWVNLVMDTLAALAFGSEPALKRYMKEKPKRRDENILSKDMWSSIFVGGSITALLSVLFLKAEFISNMFRGENQGIHHLTGFFTFFIMIAVFNSFNVRTDKVNITDSLSKNKNFLKVMCLVTVIQLGMVYICGYAWEELLRTTPMNFVELFVSMGLALVIIPLDMLRKVVMSARKK